MQKSKVLVCDRPFKCPVCRRDFVVGDEIILLLPQRTRYCSPCGTTAIKRINDRGDNGPAPGAETAGPVTVQSANCRCDDLEKRLVALENKSETGNGGMSNYVDFKTYAEKQTSILRELETLQNKLTKLETRLAHLE